MKKVRDVEDGYVFILNPYHKMPKNIKLYCAGHCEKIGNFEKACMSSKNAVLKVT